MNDRLHAIEYRRLVASVASHLSVEEVEHIKFIRLPELEGTHECDSEEKTSSALHILATLERKGEFSHQNIDGLTEIIKDVNRHDLMKQIESYKKTRMPAKKSGKSSKALKRKQLRSSEERKELEETYEMMVTRFTFLEQQMSLIPRLLEGEGDIQDEGTVILRSLKHTAEELATKLGQAHEYFGGHASETNSASESPKGDTRRGSSEDKKTNQDGSSSVSSSRISRHSSLEPSEATGHCSRDEEQDFTGDSGFSTSSRYYDDHDAYCVVDLWRRHQGSAVGTKAPASNADHGYMSVMQAGRNVDSLYATCTANQGNIES